MLSGVFRWYLIKLRYSMYGANATLYSRAAPAATANAKAAAPTIGADMSMRPGAALSVLAGPVSWVGDALAEMEEATDSALATADEASAAASPVAVEATLSALARALLAEDLISSKAVEAKLPALLVREEATDSALARADEAAEAASPVAVAATSWALSRAPLADDTAPSTAVAAALAALSTADEAQLCQPSPAVEAALSNEFTNEEPPSTNELAPSIQELAPLCAESMASLMPCSVSCRLPSWFERSLATGAAVIIGSRGACSGAAWTSARPVRMMVVVERMAAEEVCKSRVWCEEGDVADVQIGYEWWVWWVDEMKNDIKGFRLGGHEALI
jgi:hypothetical protein